MFKKSFTVLIIALLICSFPISTFALDKGIEIENSKSCIVQPLWTEIAEFTNSFDISASGKAIVESILYAFDVDEIKLKAELQQFKNGSWGTIKSWTSTSEDVYCVIGGKWYVVSGYSYRLVTTGTVYENDSQVEQETYTSQMHEY